MSNATLSDDRATLDDYYLLLGAANMMDKLLYLDRSLAVHVDGFGRVLGNSVRLRCIVNDSNYLI